MIYYLQEEMGILPDRYEMCNRCKRIYDTYEGGEGGICINESTVFDMPDEDDEEVEIDCEEVMDYIKGNGLEGHYCSECEYGVCRDIADAYLARRRRKREDGA